MKTTDHIEIHDGNGCITILHNHDQIRDHEKKVLASGMLSGFARMAFMKTENKTNTIYDISGLKKISHSDFRTLNDAFDLFDKILSIVLKADEYLIDIDHISLDLEHIYVDEKKNKISLLYLPFVEKVSWQTSFIQLMDDIRLYYNQREIAYYFEQLANYLNTSHRTVEDLLNKVSESRRDAHLCGTLYDL